MNSPATAPHDAAAASTAPGALLTPDYQALLESLPGLMMILLPDAPRFTIATCSDAYLAATLTDRSIFGRGLFQVFPDNPDDPAADGVRNLKASLERVIASKQADAMALQKYDVARPDGTGFEEKWWSPVNTPLIQNGEIRYIIHLVSDVTTEVLLKRESERQASLLTALVEAMPSGVLVADRNGKILVNNPAAQAITRMPTADIPADPAQWASHFGVYARDGRLLTADEAPLERALRGETVGQHELLVRNARNGDGVHVTVAARPLYDAQGVQIGALSVFTDIGERVATERAIAESEARYRQLSDGNPAILLRCRALPGWPMLYISKAVEGITGYAPSEFIEQGLLGQLVLAEDIPQLVESIAAQQARGEIIRVSYRIRHRDGGLRWLEGHATPVTLSDGSAGFDGAINDITARTHAARARADSERRYRQLADNNPTILYRSLNTPGWPMVFMSRAVEAITGYPASAFTEGGLLIGSLVLPEAIPKLVQDVETQLASGNVVQVEYPIRHRDGSTRWVGAYGVLQTFADGREGYEGAIADITEQRQAQRLLVERAAALERANAELDEFTYVASHDLKEPLRGIHNYARFLSEDYADRLDAGGQQMLKVVSEQAERMQRLIDDLMHIARLGREPIQQADADLDAMLDEVLASLDFSLKEKNIIVRRHPLGHLSCARVRVAELFRNLVTNAIKYNDKPEPTIEIGRTVREGKTTFFVRDNGIGIKPEFHARVFAPFKRLHAKAAYGGGTGVGLTIVKRIVEAHDGRIEIESTPDHGATFFFTLSPELNP